MDVIQPKDQIIIKQGNELHLHQLTNKPRFQHIELDAIIGKPFWSVFRKEQTKGKVCVLVHCDPAEQMNSQILNHTESGSDNRNIQDNNNAQSLTKENILSMKDEGVPSQEIMIKLIENSATFSSKTEFAQQKYVRKKANKYTDYIQILKPNLRLVAEIILRRSSSLQVLGMRIDTLSQIMTSDNLQSDGTYLVYENNCQGVIVATMLNALCKTGKLLSIVTPKYPFDKLKAIKALRFSKDTLDRLVYVNVSSFAKYSKTNECDIKSSVEPQVSVGDTLKRTADFEETESKKTTYQERSDEEVRALVEKKADGLVIACKQLPNDLAKELLQFLAPSRSFVVYCQYQEPLVKLYQDLRQRKDVIYVRLFENWLRTYQVMTNQTHPEITMSGTGGYLLIGITVL
jgi:tRNA (adenine-N(1)-)-methyltransferase non-catalytic subunit